MFLSQLPKDIRIHVLYPFMHEECLFDCVKNYPIIEVIESHPKFNQNDVLLFASDLGNLNMVKYFIQKKDFCELMHGFALERASFHGHIDVVKFLVPLCPTGNNHALRFAVANRHLNIEKYLVSVGAVPHSAQN